VPGVLRGLAHCFTSLLDGTDISPLSDRWIVRDADRRGLAYTDQCRRLAKHCLTSVDPDFPRKVRPGDVLVGGHGVGWGHDYEQAVMALRGAGIGAVVCEAVRTNFKRNCLHHGLPLVEVRGVLDHVSPGDELEIDLVRGTLVNRGSGARLTYEPYPPFILAMLDAGGVYANLARG
jgi:3-isopropylmalate/(R)-2-methylmalate dehydratase small subunit